MRIVDYTSIAIKDLRGQPLRTSLTIFALTISTVILLLMIAISIGGKQAINEQFGSDQNLSTITIVPNESANSLSPFGNVQEVNKGASKLDQSTIGRIAKLPYVASATPRAHLWELHSFSVEGVDKQFIASAEGFQTGAPIAEKAGRPFVSDDERNVVIIGYGYARELGFAKNPDKLIGKKVQINTHEGYRGVEAVIPPAGASQNDVNKFNQKATVLTATIVGVTDTGPDQNNVLVPFGWAREIRTARYNETTGLKTVDQLEADGYSAVRVNVDSVSNVKLVTDRIDELGYGQFSTLEQLEQIQRFSNIMWVILGSVALIAVIASSLGVVNTMLMSVSEQRYTIGVWRACGARKSFIMKLFLVEACILGLMGGFLGVGAGLIASHFVNYYINVLLASQNLTISDVAVVPLWLSAGTIALTAGFGVLAGLYPAFRASRLDPVVALDNGQ